MKQIFAAVLAVLLVGIAFLLFDSGDKKSQIEDLQFRIEAEQLCRRQLESDVLEQRAKSLAREKETAEGMLLLFHLMLRPNEPRKDG